MMRVATALAALLVLPLAAPSAAGQSTPAATFEVADVRPSVVAEDGPPALSTAVRIGAPRNGRYEIRRATMVDLVRTAYGVEADKVLGGPHWLEMDRFDITAKVPPAATPDTVKPMLQGLLADRFGLLVRQEMTVVPARVLRRTGTELRLSDGGTAGSCQQHVQTAAGAGGLSLTMMCRGVSMAALAEQLTRSPGLTGVTGPIVDASDLAGTYDFDLHFVPAPLAATTGGQTFAQALANLGLTLEARDVPLPKITVERVTQTPTPNDAAAVAAAFPPRPPLEFEVAEIKPSLPGSRIGLQSLPNGQLNLTAVPLRIMIGMAWNPPNEASIVGPRALDKTFDLIAKAEVGATQIDPEVVGPMLQKLLIDRLNLKVRWEERQVKGYSLVADGKHKLVRADPASRTRCAQPPAAERPVASGPMQTLRCQNMTMGEFAAQLQRISGAYFQVPVLDETGVEGRWDFTLSFSPPALAQLTALTRAPQAAPGAVGAASDPTGVMTLEEAVDRQMGLKLRARQRPGRVLVVDYVDDTPTPIK
jgi:uncharacterized protein (TIGR03435 family)